MKKTNFFLSTSTFTLIFIFILTFILTLILASIPIFSVNAQTDVLAISIPEDGYFKKLEQFPVENIFKAFTKSISFLTTTGSKTIDILGNIVKKDYKVPTPQTTEEVTAGWLEGLNKWFGEVLDNV